jgi:hypothetical protein
MGSNVLDQQLGCLWQKDHLLSISLSGYINYLDKNNPSKPLRVIKVRPVWGWLCPWNTRRGGKSGDQGPDRSWRVFGRAGAGGRSYVAPLSNCDSYTRLGPGGFGGSGFALCYCSEGLGLCRSEHTEYQGRRQCIMEDEVGE